jgi:oligopeptide/dipeptide ABC transporter ATP-binding protein
MSENNKELMLSVKDLKVEFDTYGGIVKAVRGVSFDVEKGKTLAIVGESGCGKSVTMQSIMGIIPMPPGRITSGTAILNGVDLLSLNADRKRKHLGKDISMIFQDAMTALNPTMTIGKQIMEVLVLHKGMSKGDAFRESIRLLEQVKIPEAKKRATQYPFEFSGGMLQRAMIAMALACKPKVLVADEPTTALDVTIQSQILDLMNEIQRDEKMSIIFITHDLGVVAKMADKVAVMYAGEVVEQGDVDEIFYESAHPYTIGLRDAMPVNNEEHECNLKPIEGSPPDLFHPPEGCGYYARCPHSMNLCEATKNNIYQISETHYSNCWLQDSRAPKVEGTLKQFNLEG